MELKCRNHITTGEAMRFCQQTKDKYTETVKTLPIFANFDGTMHAKFETVLIAVNDWFEQHMVIFANMVQKSMDYIFQNIYKILPQCVDSSSSGTRKKKIISNLRQVSSSLTSCYARGWGYKDTEDMSLG